MNLLLSQCYFHIHIYRNFKNFIFIALKIEFKNVFARLAYHITILNLYIKQKGN